MVGEAALISIHPEYAEKILSGEKKLEFRRRWACRPVVTLYIYATAPVRRIVGFARVEQVTMGSRTYLWQLSKEKAGGISRRKLFAYLDGMKKGVAIEIGAVTPFYNRVDPVFALGRNFHPPQSFRYLTSNEVSQINSVGVSGRAASVFFVGGVHGVGKSSCCAKVAEKAGLRCFTASTLIKAEKKSAIDEKSKNVRNTAENQDLLVRGLQKYTGLDGQRVILDGHFTLINSKHEITSIDVEVFRRLGVEGVAIFYDDPLAICKRLRERDGQSRDIPSLSTHQEMEIERGRLVASTLGIPMVLLDAFDTCGLVQAIMGDGY